MSEDRFLEVNHIIKLYPGVKALDDVSLSFRKGEIHAIVGENGAGKSTLIKILTGAIQPESGNIVFEGKQYGHFSTQTALELGISAIYQEFNLVPFLSVSENVFFGREMHRGPFVDFKQMNIRATELFKEMDISVDPQKPVRELGVAYQQIIEIVKAVSKNSKVLIMDEPSAPLTNREIDAMFAIVRKLKEKGVTIIYISHRLEEIFTICDRVSVMRDGKYIITKDTKDTNRKELISYMVGRELGEKYPPTTNKQYLDNNVALEVRNLSNEKLHDVSFVLKRGEILGFGGLVGAGRTELARAIFGADPITDGQILINGSLVNIRSPKDAIKNGMALIPEDRKNHGIILGMKITENMSFSAMDMICDWMFINRKREEMSCQKLKDELQIKTPSLRQKVKNLSGGNQQKVVLAKWLTINREILIFDEPTRGIDVGAKQEIYQLMRILAESGKSIIMISSEMPELFGMTDRIYVMHEGRITGELSKDAYGQERMLEMASGQN
jgi:ribose transport system ATP-binding protein